jgi:hypothetical protein
MNANYRRVPTRFGPETRFAVKPVPAAPFRAVQENRFERLKTILLDERLEELLDPAFNTYVRNAANEAAALAWVTPYPLLVFPGLFEEKADSAVKLAEKQEEVLERSRELLTV